MTEQWIVAEFHTFTSGFEYGPFPTRAAAEKFAEQHQRHNGGFALVPHLSDQPGDHDLIDPQDAQKFIEAWWDEVDARAES
jgi:hypothetical protein